MRYIRNPQTAGRIVDGQALVVTPDDNKLHTLNGPATRLWSLAANSCTLDEAATELTRIYRVGLDVARRDAEACLDDLAARRILSKVE